MTDGGGFDFKSRVLDAGRKLSSSSGRGNIGEKEKEEEEKIGEQLSFWPEAVAAIPTVLTRASLFRLIRRGRRKRLDDEKLESRADVDICYTGEELDQADADLWLACLRLGRGLPMGQRIYTTMAKLLREIDREDTGPNRKWLRRSLDRMSKASFKVRFVIGERRYTVTTGMLKYGIEEESRAIYLRLDPDGVRLFDNLSYVDWEVRLKLKSDGAKALQLYISGHQVGRSHSAKVTDLAAWCGYQGRVRDFKSRVLEPALYELEDKGILVKGKSKVEDNGTVCWVRAPLKKLRVGQ